MYWGDYCYTDTRVESSGRAILVFMHIFMQKTYKNIQPYLLVMLIYCVYNNRCRQLRIF